LGEVCDDGNRNDKIGCTDDCLGELPGYHCNGGNASAKDICVEQCGDSVTSPSETCDDGNITPDDGCLGVCQIELGWVCSTNYFKFSTCKEICGDGLVVGKETCDDGNKTDGRGCLDTCDGMEAGFNCTAGSSTSPSICSTVCGDGIRIKPDEVCDDGDSKSGNGCPDDCKVIEGAFICYSKLDIEKSK
jgi:cysteine-rich repeat protein